MLGNPAEKLDKWGNLILFYSASAIDFHLLLLLFFTLFLSLLFFSLSLLSQGYLIDIV